MRVIASILHSLPLKCLDNTQRVTGFGPAFNGPFAFPRISPLHNWGILLCNFCRFYYAINNGKNTCNDTSGHTWILRFAFAQDLTSFSWIQSRISHLVKRDALFFVYVLLMEQITTFILKEIFKYFIKLTKAVYSFRFTIIRCSG